MQTTQDAERLLYHYGDVVRRYRGQEEHIKELFAKRWEILDSHLRAPKLDNTPVQYGKNDDPVYDTVRKLVDVYDAQIAKAAECLREIGFEMEEIRRVIGAVGLRENELQFVELRYVERLKLKEIADKMNYSIRQIKNYGKKVVSLLKSQINKPKNGVYIYYE